MSKEFKYETCCVNSDAESIIAMVDNAKDVTLTTFLRQCDASDLLLDLGYNKMFPIKKDWHVKYFKSTYKGKPCYYMVHSAIEYVFCKNKLTKGDTMVESY